MSFLKTLLRNFEQEHGRNVESRRFINFLLRGGMMGNTTPPRQTGPHHGITHTPIRVLSIGNSLTNNTALAFQKIFQPLFRTETYDVIRAPKFFDDSEYLTPPYTHIIITGHCHSNNGRLEDDAGNRIPIVGMLEKINEMQKGLPYKIMFYNCKAYQRIFESNSQQIISLLIHGSVPEAYFANQDVQRFVGTIATMTIANIRRLLSFKQQFVQWSSQGPPFRMEPTNMFAMAAMFFGQPNPTMDQIEQLQLQLDGQTEKRKSDNVAHDDTDDNAGGASKRKRPSPEANAQSQTSSSAAQAQSPSFNQEGQSHLDMSLKEDKGEKLVSRKLF